MNAISKITNLSCFLIASLSFYFCSSIHPEFYNSDQAIHVLMAKNFSWPQDAFYWGQNRLGSLFPFLLSLFLKTHLSHPIYLASILNYSMLFFAWFVFSRGLQLKWRIIFCLAVFLPHPTFVYNILIGHPYQGQFFALAISYIYMPYLWTKITSRGAWVLKDYLKALVFLFGFLLAFWISEMSLIYLIFIFFYLFTNAKNRDVLKRNLKYLKMPFLFGISILFFGLIYILYLKSLFVSDAQYNKLFISTLDEVKQQFSYFLIQLERAFFFEKHYSIFDGVFYYILLICFLLLSYLFFKNKHPHRHLISTFFICFFISCWLLFFSSWNLRSHFDAKYYGLLYLFLWIGIGYAFQSYSNKIQWFVFVLLFIANTTSGYTMIHRSFRHETVFEQNKIEPEIQGGTILGSYWRVFKIASIFNQLKPASKDLGDARNWLKRNEWTSSRNFYIFKDELNQYEHKGDTIIYMNMKMIANRDSFTTGNLMLYRYTNLDTNKHLQIDWKENGILAFIEALYWKLRRFLFNY